MNSDEQLDKLLDRLQAPSIPEDFNARLLDKTRPKTGLSFTGWIKTLFTRPVYAGATVMTSILAAVLVLNLDAPIETETELLTDSEAELLTMSFEEALADDLIIEEDEEFSDLGASELYAWTE